MSIFVNTISASLHRRDKLIHSILSMEAILANFILDVCIVSFDSYTGNLGMEDTSHHQVMEMEVYPCAFFPTKREGMGLMSKKLHKTVVILKKG